VHFHQLSSAQKLPEGDYVPPEFPPTTGTLAVAPETSSVMSHE
jgi:hypothetical protein